MSPIPDAHATHTVLASLLLASTVVLVACGDGGGSGGSGGTTGPKTGSLSVTTSTTGQDLDPDGYTLSVDSGQGSSIGVDATDTLQGLISGSHDVDLTGVRANCQVGGSDPRTVSVLADATASTTFDVTCRHALIDQIAFDTNRDGNTEIYVMNADGSNPVDLTNDPSDDVDPAISPDGTKIAFATDRAGSLDVYVMNADGSNLVDLTNDPLSLDYTPAWSPDGSKIAFTSNRDGNYEVYVMNADGSDPVDLTNDPALDEYPAWSPDGSKIAFELYAAGNYDIYVMNADGSNPVDLTNNPAFDGFRPAWSPDGSKIAFTLGTTNLNYEIYVLKADGSSPVDLTNNPAGDENPSWSRLP